MVTYRPESGYEIQPRQFYETPEYVTEILLPHLPDPSGRVVWEPAAGAGKMVRVLSRTYSVIATDLEPQAPNIGQVDFLSDATARVSGYTDIVTNPPYGKVAAPFVRKALELVAPFGVVAMLLPVGWDSANGRRDLFKDCSAWAKEIVLLKRVRWFEPRPGDQSPMGLHAWYIWDWGHSGPAIEVYA